MATKKDKLNVVLFSGGRGTGSISEALLKYPDIELTMLVNAYDDGLSTGLLRRFIPGMLGPSDIRKVVSSILKTRSDEASQALRTLIEYRLPDETQTEEALALLAQLTNWHLDETTEHEILLAKEQLPLSQMRQISRYLTAFLEYYQNTIRERPWFTFADNSLGNLLFAGCYLLADGSFNQAIEDFCRFSQVGPRVVNVTLGENLVMSAIKEDGRVMLDEAAIVSPQDKGRIEEIFLLEQYLAEQHLEHLRTKADKISFLRQLEKLPRLNPAAEALITEADIIIYGPGTQHSSLYPSYLTQGVAETIQANKRAEKIFVANIARDHDIMADNADSLVRGFVDNMSRKQQVPVKVSQLVTKFFFQKPEKSEALDYLPFDAKNFNYPLEQVVWIDMEGDKGKHAGGRTVSELLLIVEKRLRRQVQHLPHQVSIIVPALNEQKTVKKVLEELRDLELSQFGLEKEIILVDGGSSDRTLEIAQNEPDIRTYQTAQPAGRGAALRLGIEKARGQLVVFFPSDGEYRVEDIPRVIAPLISHEFPAVFGSRAFRQDLSGTLQKVYGGRGALFTISKYGGMLLSTMTLLFYQRYVGDPLTSLKGFNARVFRGLDFTHSGVDFDMELIAKIAKAKYSILEVPVSYKARTIKQGKKITVADGLKCLVTLLKFAGSGRSAAKQTKATNSDPISADYRKEKLTSHA